jgi:hypothetical protein
LVAEQATERLWQVLWPGVKEIKNRPRSPPPFERASRTKENLQERRNRQGHKEEQPRFEQ